MINLTVQILSSAGVLVLDISTGGYEVVSMNVSGITWRTVDLTSPFVDGDHTVQAVLASQTFEVVCQIRGATWVQVEQRYQALLTALSAQQWLLSETLEGITKVWRVKRPANSTSRFTNVNVLNLLREVVIPINVQPTPTVTGV